MKIRILFGMIISAALMALFGCGGGGGGGTPAAPAGSTTVVSGTPFKGAFDSGGTVKIFGVDASGIKLATPLKATQIDVFGKYSVDIGTYTGPIVVEVTGTYKDEATGAKVTINPDDPPLRAIISNATGKDVQVNVTPLTELATQKAGAVLTASIIDAMNANIASLFKVDDIIKTKPVDATSTTSAAFAALTPAEKNQSLVLAAISQFVKNSPGKSLSQVLTSVAADITPNPTSPADVKMGDNSTVGLKTAMFDFVSPENTLNLTGVNDIANAPSIGPVGAVGTLRLGHMKISTATLPAGAIIGGIDFTVTLPAGVTMSKDSSTTANLVSPSVVVVAGVAVPVLPNQTISLATLNVQTLRTLMTNSGGFGAGEFINISCTIPSTVTTSSADLKTALTLAVTSPVTLTVTDLKGASITGPTLTVITDIF